MWDASVFVGTPVAGRGASIFMGVLVLLNILMQLSFA